MYRMSLMTFLLDGQNNLDRTKCMELGEHSFHHLDHFFLSSLDICSSVTRSGFYFIVALVHDLAESIVGDITPYCGVSKEDKKQREMDAMREIAQLIAPRGQRLMELFEVCLSVLPKDFNSCFVRKCSSPVSS